MSPIGRRCARPELRARGRRDRASRIVGTLVLAAAAALAAAPVGAQQNLGFEMVERDATPTAWSVVGGGAELAIDAAAAQGEHSLKVTRTEPGVARVVQRVPAAQLRAGGDARQTARLRLTGLARVPAPGVAAALWLRVDGLRGPLFLDS